MQTLPSHRVVSQPSDCLAVELCDDDVAWDAYVASRGSNSLFLRSAWRPVWRVYGLRVIPLAAVRDGALAGVLPLVEQRSLLTGRQLVSLPWFDAAGVLADDEHAEKALLQGALDLARERKIDSVQIRQLSARGLSPHVRTDKLLMELPLEPNGDALWKRLTPKVRNQVRKAEKSGLQVDHGGIERLGDFFQVYLQNMRDLGSPSHSLTFFQTLLRSFPAEVKIWLVRHEGRAIGGGLTMANGSALEIPWASSLKECNGLCANHLMYGRILHSACEQGFETFRFGRSSLGSGQHHFKKQWGALETPLHWYFLSDDPSVAARAAVPPQEHFGWASRIWQRLPLGLSKRIGPRLIAGIP